MLSQKTSLSNIPKHVVDGKEITETIEICTELNKYFANVGEKLVRELDKAHPLVDDNEFINYCSNRKKIAYFAYQSTRVKLDY